MLFRSFSIKKKNIKNKAKREKSPSQKQMHKNNPKRPICMNSTPVMNDY